MVLLGRVACRFFRVNLQFLPRKRKSNTEKTAGPAEKGQSGESQDINTALVLLAVFDPYFTGEKMIQDLLNIFRYSFRELLVLEMTPENICKICVDMTQQVAGALAPYGRAVVAAVATNFLQFGFLFRRTDPPQIGKNQPD